MLGSMESSELAEMVPFGTRVGMAFRLLFNAGYAGQVVSGLKFLEKSQVQPAPVKAAMREPAPERIHASGLFILSALQREGRLIDFLEQDVAGFSDEDVGAAARVIHSGCNKALKQYFGFESAVGAAEGSNMTVPPGFDAQRIRLTGNVTGQPPFKGVLKHHGWVVKEVRMPALAEGLDPRVLAPAEVELP